MKAFLGAAAAAMLFVSSALAQGSDLPATPPSDGAASTAQPLDVPSKCGDVAPEPTLPDGATATNDQMRLAETVYQTWAQATRDVILCRRTEWESIQALAAARRAEHNAAVSRLNNLTASWVGERDEYCARPRTRCQNPASQ